MYLSPLGSGEPSYGYTATPDTTTSLFRGRLDVKISMPQATDTLFQTKALLEHRLGSDLFDGIPSVTGIYRFYDTRGELLYVGKAKNLRMRLFSYKRARPGQVSRKVARMISQISRIEIEETETEREALLLENRWIREHRPPFNHANKQTEAYYFVYLKAAEEALEFRLAMHVHDDTEKEFWHGCFKGHNPVRRSMGCLLQLLWMAEHNVGSPHYLPVQLTRRLTPMRFRLRWNYPDSPSVNYGLTELLNGWIRGSSCELLKWLLVQIECGRQMDPFETHFLENRLECLKSFFDRKLVRHRMLRKHLPDGHKMIGQDELDDLIVEQGSAL